MFSHFTKYLSTDVYSIQVSCFQNPLPSLSALYSIDGVPSSRVGAYTRNQVDKSPPTPIRLQQFHKKFGHQSNQKIFSHSSRGKQRRNLMVKNCDKTANLTREKWKNGCLSHNKPLMQQFMMGSLARKNKTHGHFNNRNPSLQTWCPTYQLKNCPAMSAHHKLDLNVLGPIQGVDWRKHMFFMILPKKKYNELFICPPMGLSQNRIPSLPINQHNVPMVSL